VLLRPLFISISEKGEVTMVLENVIMNEIRRWALLVDAYGKLLRETEEKLGELEGIMVELREMFESNKNVDKSIQVGIPARPAGGDSYRGGAYAERRD